MMCNKCKHYVVINNSKVCGYTDYEWKKTIYKHKKCPLFKVSEMAKTKEIEEKEQNTNLWRVKRHVVEEYQVEGKTKEEALENVENPCKIKIVKETIKRGKI